MQTMGSDRLRALIWDLRAADRALLEFRFVDGWNYGEIVAHLAVPRGVLADRVRRLRTDLRRKANALGA
jgi:DNA-directed RNA polymerase specialized sigma24 family protein